MECSKTCPQAQALEPLSVVILTPDASTHMTDRPSDDHASPARDWRWETICTSGMDVVRGRWGAV